MIQENFIKIYENSFKENWSLPALTDYSKNVTFTFEDVAKEIARSTSCLRNVRYAGEIKSL